MTNNMFTATYELGKTLGAMAERERILQLAKDASIENDNGRFVYLSDLEDYIDFADQEKQNQG
jgi:hypothetical protein